MSAKPHPLPDFPHLPTPIEALKPYVPGMPMSTLARRLKVAPERIAKLASNENPLGPSPRALRALAEAAIDLSRYPDTDCAELTADLAAWHDVPENWVVVAAGSESLLGYVATGLLCPGRRAIYPRHAFQAFVNAVQKVGATGIVVDEPQLTVDIDAMIRALGSEPHVIYVPNPGNPTGTWVEPQALERLLAAVPPQVVVLLDEAYFEFLPPGSQGDSISWVTQYPNLIVTRTFSKAYGLAGLRVGYAISQPPLADLLRRVRSPFTVTALAQVAAQAALTDQEFLAQTLANNAQSGARLRAGLEQLGYRVLPSATNFVLAHVGDGAGWARAMTQQALIVRPVGNYGLPEWVRISIGTPAETERLLVAAEGLTGRATPTRA